MSQMLIVFFCLQNDCGRDVIGGVLFAPPAKDGKGMSNIEDGPYLEAYKKYKLKETDAEAYKRLLRLKEDCIIKPNDE